MLFIELIAQGLVQGSIYALIALGLTLVYGLLRILHVAHAALFAALTTLVECFGEESVAHMVSELPDKIMAGNYTLLRTLQ